MNQLNKYNVTGIVYSGTTVACVTTAVGTTIIGGSIVGTALCVAAGLVSGLAAASCFRKPPTNSNLHVHDTESGSEILDNQIFTAKLKIAMAQDVIDDAKHSSKHSATQGTVEPMDNDYFKHRVSTKGSEIDINQFGVSQYKLVVFNPDKRLNLERHVALYENLRMSLCGVISAVNEKFSVGEIIHQRFMAEIEKSTEYCNRTFDMLLSTNNAVRYWNRNDIERSLSDENISTTEREVLTQQLDVMQAIERHNNMYYDRLNSVISGLVTASVKVGQVQKSQDEHTTLQNSLAELSELSVELQPSKYH